MSNPLEAYIWSAYSLVGSVLFLLAFYSYYAKRQLQKRLIELEKKLNRK